MQPTPLTPPAAAAAYLHSIAIPHQVKHVLGAAVHQALALELEVRNDMDVWPRATQLGRKPRIPAVRSVLQRMPPPRRGYGRFSELLSELDAELRG